MNLAELPTREKPVKHHTLVLSHHNLLAIAQHDLLVLARHDKLVMTKEGERHYGDAE